MKKTVSVTLAFIIFMLSVIPCLSLNSLKANASEYEDKCGLGVSWYFDAASGVLNINGKGRTFEYKSGYAPWDKYAGKITSIVVAEGVTHLLSGTFDKLDNAVSLTLPSTLEAVETTAEMPALEEIIIPEKSDLHYVIQSFARESLWYHSHAEGSLIYIGTLLFGYKGKLPEDMTVLEIPEGTTAVNASAFNSKSKITDIVFPDSLIYIGYHAFLGTGWYNSQPDGLVYAGNVLYRWKGPMEGDDTVVTVKHGTKGIAEYAFSSESAALSNDKISAVTIPSTVEIIGDSAFNGCDDLLKVTFEEGCSLRKICDGAFYQCDMASFQIPETVTEIGDNAFGSTKLRSIYIPAGVLMLDGAFKSASSVDRFEVSADNPNYCSDVSGVLFNKNKTILHFYPGGNRRENYTVPEGVLYMADCAFAGSKLRSLTLNDELKATGIALFSNSYITKLDFGGGLETIRYRLFNNTNLKSLVIPPYIKTIEFRAFDIGTFTDIYFLNEDVGFEGDSVYSNFYKNKVIFHCYTNSTAHKHAEEFGINYVLFDDVHYTAKIDELIAKAEGAYRPNYTEESLARLDAVMAKINLEADGLTQYQIDDWCVELESAINNLKEKSADFSEVDSLIEQAEAINRDLYTAESLDVLDKAIADVDRNSTDGAVISGYADAIEAAISNLKYMPADYSAVEAQIKKANSLDKRCYSEISLIALDKAVNSVDYTLNITEQEQVDAYAQAISKAIDALEYAAIVLRHEPCGVIVSATAKEIKPDTVLAVEEVDSSNYEGTNFAVGGSIRSLHFYDINLVYDAVIVQPDGTVTVKIRLADGVDPAKCKVYHVTEDIVNPLVRFASTIDGNYIVFETDHFSEFAVIEVETVVESIEVSELPDSTVFGIGEELDLSGMKVIAHYSDGTSKEITDYSVGMISLNSVGNQKVKVYYTYGNITKTVEFEITVSAEKCSADITENGKSVERINKKLGLFEFYTRASIQLSADIKNADGCTLRWSSNNSKVLVDGSGKVTCKGLFGAKKANITVEVVDANGTVVAKDTVAVTFYKLSFQLSNQAFVASEYLIPKKS